MKMPKTCMLRTFGRDVRGGAAPELALGTVTLIAIAALCFDLYSRVSADTAGARMMAAMADYVSREAAPDGNELAALGDLLKHHELGTHTDVVFVVTAFHQAAGEPLPPIERLWVDKTIRMGEPTVTNELAGGCSRYVAATGQPSLPEDFASAMAPGEVLVIAEICARLRREGSLTSKFVADDIYRHHAIPIRPPDRPPAAPAYAERDDTEIIVSLPIRSKHINQALEIRQDTLGPLAEHRMRAISRHLASDEYRSEPEHPIG